MKNDDKPVECLCVSLEECSNREYKGEVGFPVGVIGLFLKEYARGDNQPFI